MQGAQVQSLTEELRSYMAHGHKTKTEATLKQIQYRAFKWLTSKKQKILRKNTLVWVVSTTKANFSCVVWGLHVWNQCVDRSSAGENSLPGSRRPSNCSVLTAEERSGFILQCGHQPHCEGVTPRPHPSPVISQRLCLQTPSHGELGSQHMHSGLC